jgi:hypothetical protein
MKRPVYIYVCVCVYIYIYIHTHTHTLHALYISREVLEVLKCFLNMGKFGVKYVLNIHKN